jgi:hypothetical protein
MSRADAPLLDIAVVRGRGRTEHNERASEVEQIGGRLSRRAERAAKLRQLLLVQRPIGLRRGERARQRTWLVQSLGLTRPHGIRRPRAALSFPNLNSLLLIYVVCI